MKKYIKLLICIIILSLSLTVVAASATEKQHYAKMSDDLKSLYYDGNQYSVVNISEIGYTENYGETYEYQTEYNDSMPREEEFEPEVVLSNAQMAIIDDIILSDSYQTKTFGIIFCAEIYYKDGSVLSRDYLRNDYRDSFEKVINDTDDFDYIINFCYPDGNILKTAKEQLFENKTEKFSYNEFEDYYDEFEVEKTSSDGEFTVSDGFVFFADDDLYYVNYGENKELYENDIYEGFAFSTGTYYEKSDEFISTYNAHKITDSELIESCRKAQSEYKNEMGLGFFDENTSKIISVIFLSFVFGIIPLAIIIASIVLIIKNKGIYRKLLTAISVISLCEIIVYIIIVILFFNS